jgi:hypothetical protein
MPILAKESERSTIYFYLSLAGGGRADHTPADGREKTTWRLQVEL